MAYIIAIDLDYGLWIGHLSRAQLGGPACLRGAPSHICGRSSSAGTAPARWPAGGWRLGARRLGPVDSPQRVSLGVFTGWKLFLEGEEAARPLEACTQDWDADNPTAVYSPQQSTGSAQVRGMEKQTQVLVGGVLWREEKSHFAIYHKVL